MRVTPVNFATAGNNNKLVTKTNNSKLNYVEGREIYPVKSGHFSDINFTSRASFSDLKTLNYIKSNFTSNSIRIYDRAEQIARQTGAKSLTTRHIYISLLQSLKEFIQAIEAGEISENGAGSNFPTTSYISNVVVPKCYLYDKHEDRVKMIEIIDKHINDFLKGINEPENQGKFCLPKVAPSKELIVDLKDIYYASSNDSSSSYLLNIF